MTKWGALRHEGRFFYTVEDLADSLRLPLPSARVIASRKTASGELLRLRRNLYVLSEPFRRFSGEELFRLANIIQTPSYVSFLSALAYYQLTTQGVRSVVESANPVRSRTFEVENMSFRYFFCRAPYFFGFKKEKGFFVAEPEKALLDALYFKSLKRYALDETALDLKGIDWKKLEKWARLYPKNFREFLSQWRDRWTT